MGPQNTIQVVAMCRRKVSDHNVQVSIQHQPDANIIMY